MSQSNEKLMKDPEEIQNDHSDGSNSHPTAPQTSPEEVERLIGAANEEAQRSESQDASESSADELAGLIAPPEALDGFADMEIEEEDISQGDYVFMDDERSYSHSTGSVSITPPNDDSVFNRIQQFSDASEVDLPLEPDGAVKAHRITGVGSILDKKYRIVDKIAEGGMGVIYGAVHIKLGKKVAIKILSPGTLTNKESHKRFIREAKASTLLASPHTVRVYDYNVSLWGEPYLVMEFISGHNLRHVLRKSGAFTAERALRVTKQIAQSLMEAHAHGLVHRDLKPSNIMLMKLKGHNDFVKIFDFGVVKFTQNTEDADLTRQGMVLGTPRYMAPEQIQTPNQVTEAADIYSLGLIYCYMLSGRKPFEEFSSDMVIFQRMKGMEVKLPKDPEITRGMRELFLRMTDKNPDRRPSADEVVGIINQLEAELKVGTFSGISALPKTSSNTFGTVLITTLVLSLFAGIGWFAFLRPPTDNNKQPTKQSNTLGKTPKKVAAKTPPPVREEPTEEPTQSLDAGDTPTPTKRPEPRQPEPRRDKPKPPRRISKKRRVKVARVVRKRKRRRWSRKKTIRIYSIPGGARVYLEPGKKYVGKTPTNIKKLPRERVVLLIKRSGYFSKKLVIPAKKGKKRYTVRLKEISIEMP